MTGFFGAARYFVEILHTRETVTNVIVWDHSLISFRITRPPGFSFFPGEYARLAFPDQSPLVWRAYSLVSAPAADTLEFFGVIVPGGRFSDRLQRLKSGDSVLIKHDSYGFMTPDRFVDGEELWLIGTGTGIGPYIAMLRHGAIRLRFKNIFLVRGVRTASDLRPYHEELQAMCGAGSALPGRHSLVVIACLSQDSASLDLPVAHGRVTSAFDDGSLEGMAGTSIEVRRSRVMLCGNPQMVEDMRTRLHQRGLAPCRRLTPGQFLTENYW